MVQVIDLALSTPYIIVKYLSPDFPRQQLEVETGYVFSKPGWTLSIIYFTNSSPSRADDPLGVFNIAFWKRTLASRIFCNLK